MRRRPTSNSRCVPTSAACVIDFAAARLFGALVSPGATARNVRVRGIQVHGGPVEKAHAGQRTAANLAGVEVGDAPLI